MESISEQISLTEAMSEARITDMPTEWTNKSRIWVQALIKVQKVNTKINWAIATNDGCGNPIIVKDFGDSAKVVRILSINPYSYLQDHYIPDLRNKNDIVKYLVQYGYNEEDVRALLDTKYKDGKEKSEEDKKENREKIKKIVTRIAIETKINEGEIRKQSRMMKYGFEREENKDLV